VSEPTNRKLPKKQPDNYLKYSGMGLKMALIMIAGTYSGIILDEWLQFKKIPIFTLLFSLLSVFLAIYYFVKDFIKK